MTEEMQIPQDSRNNEIDFDMQELENDLQETFGENRRQKRANQTENHKKETAEVGLNFRTEEHEEDCSKKTSRREGKGNIILMKAEADQDAEATRNHNYNEGKPLL